MAKTKAQEQEDLLAQLRERGGTPPPGWAYRPGMDPLFVSLEEANIKPDAEPPQNEDARASDAILGSGMFTAERAAEVRKAVAAGDVPPDITPATGTGNGPV